VINIFDNRGELIRQLCGTGNFPGNVPLGLTFGAYQPLAGAVGGLLSIRVNGREVAVWDSTNQSSNLVPNGFYQIQVIQNHNFSNSTLASGDVYVDPYHSQPSIQLSASPNIVWEGTGVLFRSLIQHSPAGPGDDPLRIFTLTGELITTLPWFNGQTSWEMINNSGQKVASGLYLAVQAATDAYSGRKIQKIVKVLFLK
jgi:hypothetical protein